MIAKVRQNYCKTTKENVSWRTWSEELRDGDLRCLCRKQFSTTPHLRTCEMSDTRTEQERMLILAANTANDH